MITDFHVHHPKTGSTAFGVAEFKITLQGKSIVG